MRNVIYSILVLTLFPFFLSAQHIEVGANFGASSYLGDLSPEKSRFSMGGIHASGGIFLRQQKNEYFAFKIAGNYGTISAEDASSSNPSRASRNLHFTSKIWEASVNVEYYILGYEPKYMTRRISPYVFLGLGYFSFNPKSYAHDGSLVELQPLRTEGQGLPESKQRNAYKRTAISIPLGGGIKFALNENINIGAEIGLRATTTDYLDDVSGFYVSDEVIAENYGDLAAAMANRSQSNVGNGQIRGNHRNKDWFVMSGITLSYNFIDSGNLFKRNRAVGCPTF